MHSRRIDKLLNQSLLVGMAECGGDVYHALGGEGEGEGRGGEGRGGEGRGGEGRGGGQVRYKQAGTRYIMYICIVIHDIVLFHKFRHCITICTCVQ